MMIHKNLIVKGKVQGVFFRASTKDVADRLGVTGFVENKADGSVYIEAEGEDSKLDEFLGWCHTGPSGAIVLKVEVASGELKNYDRFVIAR